MTSHASHPDLDTLDAIDRAMLPPDGGDSYNRLIFEHSPYLLQHASNPVDWYPWGEAAFARARAEDKPVFISIGYATCHWCHVMAAESFADTTVAAVLARHFIAVKVDREERPDIDQQYMTACQLMTGSGGWPLTLLLDLERRPFFAATYLPRTPRGGMPGLIELLERVAAVWQEQRELVLATGARVSAALTNLEQREVATGQLEERPLQQALAAWRSSFDPRHAGFGAAPKFPTPHTLSLLWRIADRFQSTDAAGMAGATLKAIRRGGIYDQVGFGLHRYAVDAAWSVPHFEKMLYDQALFIHAALDGYQATGEAEFAAQARDTISYLLRDLRSADGAFCCGEDADSEGEEGTFYLWTPEQVHGALPADLAELACQAYGITATGNFEGRSIPWRAQPVGRLAERFGMSDAAAAAALEQARQGLFAARTARPRPLRDDKLLAGWNAMTAGALARAGAVLDEPAWVSAAGTAIDFVLTAMVDARGRLRRSWRRQLSAIPAFAEDYALLGWGLTELFLASQDGCRLDQALRWSDAALQLFGDGNGDLWESGADAEAVLGRGRNTMDGAMPAAGSILALTLLRLADLTGTTSWRDAGEQLLGRRLGRSARQPEAHAQLLIALDYALGPTQQVVVAQGSSGQAHGFLAEVRHRFLPRAVYLVAGHGHADVVGLSQLAALHSRPAAATAAWLCNARACQPASANPRDLGRQLDAILRRTTPANLP
jgi:uncharacterized protein YyaL (SSP411 family)